MAFAHEALVDAATPATSNFVSGSILGYVGKKLYSWTRAQLFGPAPNLRKGYVRTFINGTNSDKIWGLALLSDGRIVAVGNTAVNGVSIFDAGLYSADGVRDNTFGGGTDGCAEWQVFGASSLGDTFGNAGNPVTVDAQNRIYVTGTSIDGSANVWLSVTRLNTNGTVDTTYATNGIFTYRSGGSTAGYGIAIDSSGRAVVCGNQGGGVSAGPAVLLRLTTAGALDTSFGTGGVVTEDMGGNHGAWYGVTFDASGNIVVCGEQASVSANSESGEIARYTSAGVLDTTFNSTGKVNVTRSGGGNCQFVQPLIQGNGKIVAVGRSSVTGAMVRIFAFRCSSAGVTDTTFNATGQKEQVFSTLLDGNYNGFAGAAFTSPNDSTNSARKLIVGFTFGVDNASSYAAGLCVFNLNSPGSVNIGSLDLSFGQVFNGAAIHHGGGVMTYIGAMIPQPGGKLIMAGWTSDAKAGNACDWTIIRTDQFGLLDRTFGDNA